MNILIDTHYLLWVLSKPEKIGKKTLSVLNDPENCIFASSVNFWEISLKSSIGKMVLQNTSVDEIFLTAKKSNINMIGLTPEESATYYNLPPTNHKDPFDRMLIWQAICNDFYFLTEDSSVMKYYSKHGLKLV